MRVFILIIILWVSAQYPLKAQLSFPSLDSLLNYAQARNINLQSGEIRMSQAKKARLAALLAIADPAGSASFSYTNNTRLPVNLFPAEIFGGSPGSFQEIVTGVQYISNLNSYAELKLLNLQGWENLKSSKLNIDLTASDNRLSLKSWQEQVAPVYYNIVSLKAQREAAEENLVAADSLRQLVERRLRQGLVRSQELNDAQANYLNAEESIRQIQFTLDQQYLALKILCDLPEGETLELTESLAPAGELQQEAPEALPNFLDRDNYLLREKMAWSNYRQSKLAFLPTISFFLSQTQQQFNTRSRLFDGDARWIPSSYLGVKINMPLPSAGSVSQLLKARYEYQLAQKQAEQVQLRQGSEFRRLDLDFQKALSQYQTNRRLYELQRDTYAKNRNNYSEGLISLDQTLNSLRALTNSRYEVLAAAAGVMLAEAKIDINNKIR